MKKRTIRDSSRTGRPSPLSLPREPVDVLVSNAAGHPVLQGGPRWSVQFRMAGVSSFQSTHVASTRPGVIEQVSVECEGAKVGFLRIQRSDQQAAPVEFSLPGGGGIGSMSAGYLRLTDVDRPPNFGGPARVLSPTPFLLPFTSGFDFMVLTDDPASVAPYVCYLSVVGAFTG